MPANLTSRCTCQHVRTVHDLAGACGGYLLDGKPTSTFALTPAEWERLVACTCTGFDWKPAGTERSRAMSKARREVERDVNGHSGRA